MLHRVRWWSALAALAGAVVLLAVTAVGWVEHRDPWTAVCAAVLLLLSSLDVLIEANEELTGQDGQ